MNDTQSDARGGVERARVATPDPDRQSLSDQPLEVVDLDEVTVTLLGTAHVSARSADEVQRLIEGGGFDAVAIELDPSRHASITDPDRWAKLDLFKVLRSGQAGMVAANLALSAFQQRLADQLGIEPGQEMRVAIRAATEAGLPLLLIDRDIGVTLRRVYRNVPWWQRITLFGGLLASVVSREEITEEEIEKLKEGDMLEATFAEFAENSAALYGPLIAERDAYMATRLQQEAARLSREPTGSAPVAPEGDGARPNILAVLGAGHLKGTAALLRGDPFPGDATADGVSPEARLARLNEVPPPGRWRRLLPWLIVALILTGFAIGFLRSPELGLVLLADWFLINGTLAALGALIALAHPVTIVGTFLAAPLTSLNPLIGAGFVAAGLELWFRKPKVGDFERLRSEVTTVGGWWRNRVARTLLVFLFATLGSVAGTYLAGFRIAGRLFG